MQLLQMLSPSGFVLPFLIATVIQVTVLAGATLLASFFLRRRSAAVRHAVLLTGLAAIWLAPAACLCMHATRTKTVDLRSTAAEFGIHNFRFSDARQIAERQTVSADLAVQSSATPPQSNRHQEASISLPLIASSIPATESLDAPPARAVSLCAVFLMGVWLIGFAAGMVGFVRGHAAARRLINESRPIFDSALQATFDETLKLLSASIRPRLQQSSTISSPLVVGVLRPTIVLPRGLEQKLGRARLRSVLLHETAHVLRRDNLVGLLQRILGIVWWPHPLIHRLNRRLSQAREEICDNYVMTNGERHEYARTLLQMSTSAPACESLAAAIGLLQPRWRLEDRVRGLLDDGRSLGLRVGRIRGLVILGVMGAAMLLLAGATVMPPTEEEAIQNIRSLGGSVTGPNGAAEGTERVMLTQDWTGTTAALTQLKHIRGIKEIWFCGTTIDEVVLEDLPDLERIVFVVNFYDDALDRQVNWRSLPIRTVRLKNLPKIKSFDRSGGGNNLSETQVTTLELVQMDNLTNLHLAGLQLQDDVLQSVSGAPHLKSIQACRPTSTRPGGHTQITDAGLKSLPLLTELSSIDLDGARITDDGLKTIGMLTALESLGLCASGITDNGLNYIAPLSRLRGLGISETQVTDEGLKRIVAQHPKLRSIGLGGSAVTAAGLDALQGLPELARVELDSSQLSEQSCAVLSTLPIRTIQINGASTKPGRISSLPKIDTLFVHGAENLSIAPGALAGLKALYLRGAGANATRSFFQHFSYLQKLEQLDVSTGWTDSGAADTQSSLHIDDELMQHVGNLKTLKLLWLAASQIDLGDKGAAAIARLTSLEGLLLPKTKITDQGVSHFAGLAHLKRLNISGEGITNDALVHFKSLKQLRQLNLNNTSVDQEAAEQLKADLPGANIQAYRIE